MKLKYYLRGLGIGILVTAIIMSFTKKPEELTDAEIKIRAKQLGMVEENVLADIQKNDLPENHKEEYDNTSVIEETNVTEDGEETTKNPEQNAENTEETEADVLEESVVSTEEETAEEAVTNTETEIIEATVTEAEEETAEEAVTGTEEESIEEVVANAETEAVEEIENYIIISVMPGNGSEVISQRLFEAGLVNSAVEYNRYLIENGYDKRLRVGEHEIPANANEEEIAKILSGIN